MKSDEVKAILEIKAELSAVTKELKGIRKVLISGRQQADDDEEESIDE